MADGSVKIDITADDKDIKKKLKDVGDEAEDGAEGLDDLGDSAEGAGKSFGVATTAIGNFIANGLTAMVSKMGECLSSIVSLADETREYREDMAKLDAAFTTAGHSTETAQQAYDGFYRILGESDRSVEAVNHLAELTQNEQELAQWSTICAGVTAKFGDSLPIEGLTEAANETAKVGQVTGPLADALNWAGISEDEFNAKLAACNSEQERATLITSTLNKEYAAAAEEYNKLTANAQAARDATNQMEQAQAALGGAIEPIITLFKSGLAGALQSIVPHFETIGEGIQEMLGGVDGGAEKVSSGVAGVFEALVSTITAALPTLLQVGVSLIVSLVNGVVSALPSVVTAIVEALPMLIEGILGAADALIGALPQIIETICAALPTLIPQLIDGIVGLVLMIVEMFPQIIQPLIDNLPDIIVSIVEAIVNNLPA